MTATEKAAIWNVGFTAGWLGLGPRANPEWLSMEWRVIWEEGRAAGSLVPFPVHREPFRNCPYTPARSSSIPLVGQVS